MAEGQPPDGWILLTAVFPGGYQSVGGFDPYTIVAVIPYPETGAYRRETMVVLHSGGKFTVTETPAEIYERMAEVGIVMADE